MLHPKQNKINSAQLYWPDCSCPPFFHYSSSNIISTQNTQHIQWNKVINLILTSQGENYCTYKQRTLLFDSSAQWASFFHYNTIMCVMCYVKHPKSDTKICQSNIKEVMIWEQKINKDLATLLCLLWHNNTIMPWIWKRCPCFIWSLQPAQWQEDPKPHNTLILTLIRINHPDTFI